MPSFALPRLLSRRSTTTDHKKNKIETRVVTAASVAKSRQLLLLGNHLAQFGSNISPSSSLNSKSFDSRTLAMATGAAKIVSDVVSSSRRSSFSTSFSTAASATSDDHSNDYPTDSAILNRLKAINLASFGFNMSSSSTSTSQPSSKYSTSKSKRKNQHVSDLPPTSPMSSMYDPRSPSASTASASIPISDDSLSSSRSPRVSDDSDTLDQVQQVTAFQNLRSMFENNCATNELKISQDSSFIKSDRPRSSKNQLYSKTKSSSSNQQNLNSISKLERSSSTRSDYYYQSKYSSNRKTTSTRESNINHQQFPDSITTTKGSFINTFMPIQDAPSSFYKSMDRRSTQSRMKSNVSDRISSNHSRSRFNNQNISSYEARSQSNNHFSVDPAMLRKSSSAKNLGMPLGKVEELPTSRPCTPCRLPRPRVFISQSSSSALTTDAVAVKEEKNGEAKFVTRQVPRPTRENSIIDDDLQFSNEHEHEQEEIPTITDDEFYDTEELSNIKRMNRREAILPGNTTEVISTKARRAVNALRSISFQAQQLDDLDTAWGQAVTNEDDLRRSGSSATPSNGSSKWRRPRVRTSNKKNEADLELRNDYDMGSLGSTDSNRNRNYDRISDNSRNYRGMSPRKNIVPGNSKQSLWNGARNSNESQVFAAQLFASNTGSNYLAASSNGSGINTLTAVPHVDSKEMIDANTYLKNGPNNDKYVDFIHASAERETKSSKGAYKTLPGRVMTKAQSVFRRKWK